MFNFDIGDQVVLSPFSGDFAKSHDALYDIFDFENDLKTLAVMSDRKGGEVRSSIQHLRYPTKEEIAAGHRIDKCNNPGNEEKTDSSKCDILDHPEDYTSPNCKKYDEQVK